MASNENEPRNGHNNGLGVARRFDPGETIFAGLTHIADIDIPSTNGVNGHGNGSVTAADLVSFFRQRRRAEKKKVKKG